MVSTMEAFQKAASEEPTVTPIIQPRKYPTPITTMKPAAATASRTLRHSWTTRIPLIQPFVRRPIGLNLDRPLGTMWALFHG